MRIAIDIGHNLPVDIGAIGIKEERKLNSALGKKVMALLEREGHEVIDCLPRKARDIWDSLGRRCAIANRAKADLFVSLHFNAFNGLAFGTEVWLYSNKARETAENVVNEIAKLGFSNRGVKYGNFFVLRNTKMPAILVECCFCDSHRDISKYDVNNMAIAIKNGIVGKSSQYVPTAKTQYLQVLHDTVLKGSVEQAKNLKLVENKTLAEDEMVKLPTGKYTIAQLDFQEEGHWLLTLKSGLRGFVYGGHVDVVNK